MPIIGWLQIQETITQMKQQEIMSQLVLLEKTVKEDGTLLVVL